MVQDSFNNISTKIDVMIVEESFIRPRHFYSAFPVNHQEMVPLKQHLPCVECGRYWAEMAFVNLPCGCLLHPVCLFQVALSSKPCCPGCNVKPSAGWMGQWGFKSDLASEKVVAAALKLEGWAPPLSRTEAKLQFAKQKLAADVSTSKQACLSVLKATTPKEEGAGHFEAAVGNIVLADAEVIKSGALPCNATDTLKFEVKASNDVESGTMVAVATSEIEVVAADDNLQNQAETGITTRSHEFTTSYPSRPASPQQELPIETSVDDGEILDIANAAAAAVDPTSPL